MSLTDYPDDQLETLLHDVIAELESRDAIVAQSVTTDAIVVEWDWHDA